MLIDRRLTSRQLHLRDALVDLVLAQGFSHLTMDDFAAQLNCSKRTLYALAASKEQIAVLAVRQFFSAPPSRWRRRSHAPGRRRSRVTRYLEAVAEALRPASRAFRDDLADFRPAAEIYEQNTLAAARRVRELIEEGTRAGAFRQVPAAFVERGGDGNDAAHHQRGDRRRHRPQRRRGLCGARPAGRCRDPPLTCRTLWTHRTAYPRPDERRSARPR